MFTGNPHSGRCGLFPPDKPASASKELTAPSLQQNRPAANTCFDKEGEWDHRSAR
jgi:hypothetical protein